ncbi:MAG TPA: hypothetical protein VG982_02735 [Candidatus Paceibacterota bacterium]|nr:hypothetical protein [Candidatus Paceibacterota bacterium]
MSNYISIANLIVLSLTLWWLIKYTRATQQMVENQMMPSVNVNMIYDKNINKTRFWFSNGSKFPAMVSVKLGLKEMLNLFISPSHEQYKEIRHTAGIDISVDEIQTMNVAITSALKNTSGKWEFSKSYRFNKNKMEWDEITWGFPDPAFPNRINT